MDKGKHWEKLLKCRETKVAIIISSLLWRIPLLEQEK